MGIETPVVVLAYNRPELTRQVVEAVASAAPGRLYVVCDGPKSGDPADAEKVRQTRDIFENLTWECDVRKIYADENFGLKQRVVSGLTEVFRSTDRAVILEDDCLPDKSFFPFCEELLARYDQNPEVGIISGSCRLRGAQISPYSYNFSTDVRIWGWATWSRTWDQFLVSGALDASWNAHEQHELTASLPSGARRKAMRKMLHRASHLDSWALPFAVHFRQQNYVSAVPRINLIENIGFGAGSTHTRFEDYVSEVPAERMPGSLIHPPTTEANLAMDVLESRLDLRERWRYPLRHPWDTLGRFWRYFRGLSRSS